MTEIIVKVYDSVEAEHETRNLRKLGYERTQNAFWVEHWKKGDHLVILERDFQAIGPPRRLRRQKEK